jgi:hypothetical protein
MKRFRLNLRRRLVPLALAAIGASLVAAGCGSDSSGGKATSAKGLDFVPKSTLLYIVADTDFEGKNWDQARSLAQQFNGYEAAKAKALKKLEEGKNGVKWSDVKAWLGDEAGVAVLSAKGGKGGNGTFFAWIDVTDVGKAEKTLTGSDKVAKAGSVAGSDIKKDTASDGNVTYYAFADKTLLVSEQRASVALALKTGDGNDSITDQKDVKDVADQVDKDALVSMVVNGPRVATALRAEMAKNSTTASLSSLSKSKLLDALKGAEVSLTAKDKGFQLAGYVGVDPDQLDGMKLDRESFQPKLAESLPKDTALAIGGQDLGGSIKTLIGQVEQAQPSVKTQLTQLESVLGLKVDDIATALGGEFALGVHGTATQPAVTAVLEAKDETKTRTVMGKLFGAVGTLTGGAAKQTTEGDVVTNSVTVAGQTLYESTADGTSIVTNSPTATAQIRAGGDGLGSTDTYKRVSDEAGMPNKVGGLLFANVQALLAAAKGSGLATGDSLTKAQAGANALGPWIGWLDTGKDHASFDVFMEIDKNAQSDAMKASATMTK